MNLFSEVLQAVESPIVERSFARMQDLLDLARQGLYNRRKIREINELVTLPEIQKILVFIEGESTNLHGSTHHKLAKHSLVSEYTLGDGFSDESYYSRVGAARRIAHLIRWHDKYHLVIRFLDGNDSCTDQIEIERARRTFRD